MTGTLDSGTFLRRTENWLGAVHDGEVIMMEAMSGRFLSLNDSASRIWALLETPATLGKIGAALASEYVVAEAEAVRDIQPFIREMLANGVLSIESADGA